MPKGGRGRGRPSSLGQLLALDGAEHVDQGAPPAPNAAEIRPRPRRITEPTETVYAPLVTNRAAISAASPQGLGSHELGHQVWMESQRMTAPTNQEHAAKICLVADSFMDLGSSRSSSAPLSWAAYDRDVERREVQAAHRQISASIDLLERYRQQRMQDPH